jgi:hypothetical protein
MISTRTRSSSTRHCRLIARTCCVYKASHLAQLILVHGNGRRVEQDGFGLRREASKIGGDDERCMPVHGVRGSMHAVATAAQTYSTCQLDYR